MVGKQPYPVSFHLIIMHLPSFIYLVLPVAIVVAGCGATKPKASAADVLNYKTISSGPTNFFEGKTVFEVTAPPSYGDAFVLDSSFQLCFSDTVTKNAVSYDIRIYNRWAELIMTRCFINDCWDGKRISDNTFPPNGIYYWVVIIGFKDKEPQVVKGTVWLWKEPA